MRAAKGETPCSSISATSIPATFSRWIAKALPAAASRLATIGTRLRWRATARPMRSASPRSTSRPCGLRRAVYDDEIGVSAEVVGLETLASEFNVLDRLWNARVTSHIPLKDVSVDAHGRTDLSCAEADRRLHAACGLCGAAYRGRRAQSACRRRRQFRP